MVAPSEVFYCAPADDPAALAASSIAEAPPNAQLRVLNPHVSAALEGKACVLPTQLAALRSTAEAETAVASRLGRLEPGVGQEHDARARGGHAVCRGHAARRRHRRARCRP